jgi:NAD(P)-dependent dehydrogenase (short-subunit alcohol dehydrogenase family)
MLSADDRAFNGKVAVVTGAGRGIGREVALLLASLGAKVVVNDLGVERDGSRSDEGPARVIAEQINRNGGDAIASFASVAEWDSAESIIRAAIDEFGGIDILVNVAGLSGSSSFADLGKEEFETVVGASLFGTFNCMRHAAPHMIAQKSGRIVNFLSRAGLVGMAGAGAYAAAKGGVFGLTNAVAPELLPHGILVNGVNPAATNTRMLQDGGSARSSEHHARMLAVMQEPAHVAAVTAYLCSEQCTLSGRYILVEQQAISLLAPISAEWRAAIGSDEWELGRMAEAMASTSTRSSQSVY